MVDNNKINHIYLCDHALLEDMLSIPLSSKEIFINQFMNMPVKVTYEKSSMIGTKIVKILADCRQGGGVDKIYLRMMSITLKFIVL